MSQRGDQTEEPTASDARVVSYLDDLSSARTIFCVAAGLKAGILWIARHRRQITALSPAFKPLTQWKADSRRSIGIVGRLWAAVSALLYASSERPASRS
jgi:hypothetical protein